ncbi:MAG TPA: LysR family transcriptional regulator [Hyphomonas sp.]|jgi:DNA-binding transcriptional LysR family regulator|uniref:Transcriptional regulator, LysR family n=1 Tax=hydrothermal vent metagenome TaxID=652676 RepID=A0A160U232_9ZZZZ|nr:MULTISPECIES: LysR family transcriptional regulator [unclassified Hyphomonas]MAN90242.1 LysR family transcriptional regulator [Hyphomonadaceae bacterium]MAA81930.1 LysR family transcriptional regulator [Hyphomonas sp.]MBG66887.1 LysR family transcriptional regulator [Hyphomonas sp.]MBO6582713.1 LysR family transcriptional regulator [Hyphomonas sp.]MDF1805038.1 LysR family transcriptional regulator [Hyphomonas sp.]|tara:strand:+ start:24576 stop:25466 length:891 start_codon:yes stop_codon:yes gene_type:complete
MQITALQTFVDVMKLGSFANAARYRDVDPSSVSRAIAGLEEELGFRLFQRSRRKLAPTEAGQSYFEQIRNLIEDLDHARQKAQDLATEPQGLLRITACTSLGQRVIAPLLKKFMDRYPALSLELVLTDSQVDLVADQIDLGIRFGPEPDGEMCATKLVPRKFQICASPSYIQRNGGLLHPRDLSERECVLFPLPGYRTHWLFRDAAGEAFEVPVNGRLLVSHGLTMTQCALAGLGPTLLPDWLCKPELEAGDLVDLFPDFECAANQFGTAAWMVHPSRRYVPHKVEAFMQFLREEI